MDEGAFFPECQIAATTFTSSSLATVSTGAYPQLHGIVADSWYDRATKKSIPATPEALQATTLADQIAASDPSNRIFAVALDSPDAALLAGQTEADLFHRGATGQFMARGQAENADWLTAFNQANSPEKLRNAGWFATGAKEGTPALGPSPMTKPTRRISSRFTGLPGMARKPKWTWSSRSSVQQKLGQGPGIDFLAVALGLRRSWATRSVAIPP